jgi:hypothetical protein
VGRNLKTIGRLVEVSDSGHLPRTLYKKLRVIHELYRQQRYMYINKVHPEFMQPIPAESSRLLDAAEKINLKRAQQQAPAISYRTVYKEGRSDA